MTIEEFSSIGKHKLLDLIINTVFSIAAIVLSIYFQIKLSPILGKELSRVNLIIAIFMCIIFLALMALGIYGLFILIKPLKADYWENKMTKDENIDLIKKLYVDLTAKNFQIDDNLIQFTHQKSFWSYNQTIYFFTENNLLGIYVKTDSGPKQGFLDFGAASRTQRKLLKMLSNKASR